MKRSAVVAALVAAIVAGVGVLAWTAPAWRDDGRGRHGPMMSVTGDVPEARWGLGPGPGGHHGAASYADSEYTYLVEMIAHHREAVAAANQLRRSDRPMMREFGASIAGVQSRQVRQLRGWLTEWYPDRPTEAPYEPMMRDLSGLDGEALDVAFVEDMIGHHMVAVMMSQQFLVRGPAEHPQVARLARTIRDDQHAEIFRMQRWLGEWLGRGWYHGPGWPMAYHPWMMSGR